MMKNDIFCAVDARQTPEWGEYLKSLGWRVETIDTTQLFIRKFPLINTSFIKIQHPFGPIPFQKIDEFAEENKTMWTSIEPHRFGYDEKEFMKNGYRRSKKLYAHSATIKIDITKNEEELFKSFSENAKRNIKKAQNRNLEIKTIFMKETKNWKYFNIFYSLLKNLSQMKHFYVPSYREYHDKMTAFKETSILLFAYENSIPIAVVWYACFENVMAYFQTGITRRGYETLANYLLVWEGLLVGKKLHLSVFDFESIFDERFPNDVRQYKKYTEFKKRFHGELVLYPPPWIKIHTFMGEALYLCGV